MFLENTVNRGRSAGWIEVVCGSMFSGKTEELIRRLRRAEFVSLFTGEQAIALKVEPNLVLYGITTQKADHWKSLGPMNLLDISYLDDDLRIMRGTTSSESIFIFKRM